MRSAVHRVPVLVHLAWVVIAAMSLPALLGLIERDYATAQAFFYWMLLLSVGCVLVTLTTRSTRDQDTPLEQLLTLLAAYTLLPAAMALPFAQAVGSTFWEAWFEMISSTTTTGGTLFDQGQFVPRAAHFWRSLAGWLGGLLIWVAAIAVLAPMKLGGYEVRAPRKASQVRDALGQTNRFDLPADRFVRYGKTLTLIYGGLTLTLFLLLLGAGDDELVALTHAMAIISTSGISPAGGLGEAASGLRGEMFMLLFFMFAFARSSFTPTILGANRVRFWQDPEFHLALSVLALAFVVVFGRHWIDIQDNVHESVNVLTVIWGMIFTFASFLSTTGFESDAWVLSAFWSGLNSPGLVLIGLAMIGGGVATTAGGVKLMRVYVLGQHMKREVGQMISPNAVHKRGAQAIRGQPQGAYIAWVMFMLFALSLAAVMLALAATGLDFQAAFTLSIAALSNCGPLVQAASGAALSFANAGDQAQVVLCFAMVAGRLEALAIIALLNREIWLR